MPTRVVTITINAVDRTQRALYSVSRRFEVATARIAQTGLALTWQVSLPLYGIATAATKAASEFSREMRNIQSISGLTGDQIKLLGQAFQVMSTDLSATTDSATELAQGFYFTWSAGFEGAQAMEVLTAATKAASAGLTDTETAVNALTAVLNAYGMQGQMASQVSDVLFRTVDKGVLTFGELASSIGDVVNSAAIAQVPIEQLGAAYVVMTRAGISAHEAATGLNRLILSLISPSAQAAQTAAELGIEFNATALASKGLQGVLADVIEKTGGTAEAIRKLFPDVRAYRAVLSLTRGEMGPFNQALADMGQAAGATGRAFAAQTQSWAAQLENLKNAINSLLISVGDALVPTLLKAREMVVNVKNAFLALPEATRQQIVQTGLLVAALGPALALIGGLGMALGRLVSTLVVLARTFLPVIAGVSRLNVVTSVATSLIAGIVTNFAGMGEAALFWFSQIVQAMSQLPAMIQSAISGPLAKASLDWQKIGQIALQALGVIGNLLVNVVGAAINFAINAFGGLIQVIGNFLGLLNLIVQAGKALGDTLLAVFTGDFAKIEQIWTGLWEGMKNRLFGIAQGIIQIVLSFVGSLWDIIANFSNRILGTAIKPWEEISAGVREKLKELNLYTETTTDDIAKSWGEAGEKVGITWGESISDLIDRAKAMGASVSDWSQLATDALGRFGDAAGELGAKFGDLADQVQDSGSFMADTWQLVLGAMEQATSQYTSEEEGKVFDHFNGLLDKLRSSGEKMGKLIFERNKRLAKLDEEYQKLSSQLLQRGEKDRLAVLATAYQTKRAATLAYYNGRIKKEKTAQDTLLKVAAAYHKAAINILTISLQAKVKSLQAHMKAMREITISSYASMAEAAAVFAQIQQDVTDIQAIEAAINELRGLYGQIQSAADQAAQEAIEDLSNWEEATGSLNEAIGGLGGGARGMRERVVDPIKEAAEQASRMRNLVENALEVFNLLAGWEGPPAGWGEKFQELADTMADMIERWAAVVERIRQEGLLEKEQREGITAFADMVSSVAKAVSAAADLASKLADQAATTIGPAAERLLQQMAGLTRKVARIADELGPELIGKATSVADGLSQALKPWKPAVAAVEAIASHTGRVIGPTADGLAEQMKGLTLRMATISDQLGPDLLKAAAQGAQQLSEALKPWKPAVEAVQAIAGHVGRNIAPTAAGLVEQIKGLAIRMATINDQLGPDLIELAAAGADQIVAALKPWKPAVEAVQAIAGHAAVRIGPTAELLVQQMAGLTRKMARIAGELGPQILEDAARAGQQLTQALRPWQEGVRAMQALADYSAVAIGATANLLLAQMVGLTRKLANARGQLDQAQTTQAAEMAELMRAIGQAIKTAVEGLEALASYSGQVIGQTASQLVADFSLLVEQLDQAASDLGRDALNRAQEMAEAMGAIGGGIKRAVEGLNALLGYEGGLLAETVVTFVADAEQVVRAFGETRFDQDLLKRAEEFAKAVSAVGGSLGRAVEGLQTLLGYEGGLFSDSLTAFMDDLNAVVEAFGQAEFDSDLLKRAQDFAQTVGKVGQAIRPAVEGLGDLLDYSGGLLEDTVKQFLDDLSLVVRDFAQSGFSAEMLAQARNFAQTVGAVGQAIQPAIEGLSGLLTYSGGLLVSTVKQFLADLILVVRDFAQSGFSAEMLAQARDFAQTVGQIGQVIEPAVRALGALLAYQGGLTLGIVQDFVNDISLVIDRFHMAAYFFGSTALKEAQNFAAAVRAVGEAIGPAVQGLGQLLAYQGGLTLGIVQGFVNDISLVIDRFRMAANLFGEDALRAAQDFAAAVRAVGESLGSAIQGLSNLLSYTGGVSMASFDTFMADLRELVRRFAEAAGAIGSDLLKQAQAFAQAAGQVGQAVSGAVRGLEAVLAYEGGLSADTLDTFMADLMAVVDAFGEATRLLGEDALAEAQAFAAAAQAVGSALQSAVSGLEALLAYVGGLSQQAMRAFKDDLTWVVQTFADLAAFFGEDALAGARDMAQTAQQIGQALQSVSQGLEALVTYAGPSRDMLDRFLADIQYLVQQLVDAAGNFGSRGLKQALEFAQTAKAIGEALVAVYQGLVGEKGIANYLGLGHDVIDRFVADMEYVLRRLVDLADEFDPDGLAAARRIAQTMKEVGNALGAAGDLAGLAEYAALARDKFDVFLEDMRYIVGQTIDVASAFSDAALAHAKRFSQAASEIFKAIAEGLEAGRGILGWGHGPNPFMGLADQMEQMAAELIRIYTRIINDAWEFGQDWIRAMMRGINDLWPALMNLIEQVMASFPSPPAATAAALAMPAMAPAGALPGLLQPAPATALPPLPRQPEQGGQVLYNYGVIEIVAPREEDPAETWRRLFGQVRGGVV